MGAAYAGRDLIFRALGRIPYPAGLRVSAVRTSSGRAGKQVTQDAPTEMRKASTGACFPFNVRSSLLAFG